MFICTAEGIEQRCKESVPEKLSKIHEHLNQANRRRQAVVWNPGSRLSLVMCFLFQWMVLGAHVESAHESAILYCA